MRACVAAALQHAPFVHHGGAAGRPVQLMGIGAGVKQVRLSQQLTRDHMGQMIAGLCRLLPDWSPVHA